MTQTPEPIDLDAIEARYDAFEAAWAGYPLETGETEAEYRERVEPLLTGDAVASAQDVPALVEEVVRLRGLLAEKEANVYAVGWAVARYALERESVAWQERGDTARWAMLAVAAATLRRLEERPHFTAPKEDVSGLIDVETVDGVQRRTLTCSVHGQLGHYLMVPIVGESEPEQAWRRHLAEQHEGG